MKKLLLSLAFCLFATAASAQCNGVFSPGTYCGNSTTSPAPPTATSNLPPLDVRSYGAQCDNSTDDTVAFQNAITAAGALSRTLTFSGFCRITSALNVSNGITIQGAGAWQASTIIANSNITVFNVTQIAPVFQNFGIYFQFVNPCGGGGGATNTASIPFKFSTPWDKGDPVIRDVFVGCPYIGVQVIGTAGFGNVDNLRMTQVAHYGFDFELDGSNTPAEGWMVHNGWYSTDGVHSGVEIVHCVSCNGLQFFNNISEAATPAFAIGVHAVFNFTDGDLFINNNAFEGIDSASGIVGKLERASGSITNGTITIVGNELNGAQAIVVPTDPFNTNPWLQGLTITGNTLTIWNNATPAIAIDNAAGFIVGYNDVLFPNSGATHTPIAIGSHAQFGVAGPNVCIVAQQPPGLGGCTASTNAGSNITTIAPF